MNRDPIKCDRCGRFIRYADLDSGEATIKFVTPDSFFTKEEYWHLCKACKFNDQAEDEHFATYMGG